MYAGVDSVYFYNTEVLDIFSECSDVLNFELWRAWFNERRPICIKHVTGINHIVSISAPSNHCSEHNTYLAF